jgi:hypothetical protein
MSMGQHIRARRPAGWVAAGMLHHGIDLGDSTVMHFTGANTKTAMVVRTSILLFESECPSEIVDYDLIRRLPPAWFGGEYIVYSNLVCRPPEEVVTYSLLSQGVTGYHPYLNNCEHFATCMMTGTRFSLQSEQFSAHMDRMNAGVALASILIEFFRFRNPRPTPKSGGLYCGSLYSHNGLFFFEQYPYPGETPPNWFVTTNRHARRDDCQSIDAKAVPYPLAPVAHYYTSGGDDIYEVPAYD